MGKYSRKTLSFNGAEISYFTEGRGHSAIIFLHGDYENHTIGIKILDSFPAQNKHLKIIIDRPGHGMSQFLPNRTPELESELLHKIISKEKIREAILFGHSSGAAVCLEYAIKHPVKALILSNPFFFNPEKALWYLPTKLMKKLYIKSIEKFKSKNPVSIYHEFGSERTSSEIAEKGLIHTSMETIAQNLNMYNNYDVTGHLHKINTPVLIISTNKGSTSIHNHTSKYQKGLPRSKFILIDGEHNDIFINAEKISEMLHDNKEFLRL